MSTEKADDDNGDDNQALLRLFEARAKDLARPLDAPSERELLFHAVLINLGDQMIGLPIDYVRELATPPPVTALFGMPRWFAGVVCLHAQIVSVIDLAQWLGIQAPLTKSCLVILSGKEGDIGVLADHCIGFRAIHADDIDTAIAQNNSRLPAETLYVTRDFCTILNIPKLLGDPRLCFGAHTPNPPDEKGAE